MDRVTFAFGGGFKTQKSSSAHVRDHRICYKGRMTILFVSTYRYDPKDTFKHTYQLLEIERKFFTAFKLKYDIH